MKFAYKIDLFLYNFFSTISMLVLSADNMDGFRMLVMCLIGMCRSNLHQIHVSINFRGKEVQMGTCDQECLSLVSLINDMLEEVYKRHRYDNENFQGIAIIPWSCERQHLKTGLDYTNLVNLILEKGFDFLKLEMDVVAMDTLSPVKRRLFNKKIRSSTSQPPNQTTLEHQLSPYIP